MFSFLFDGKIGEILAPCVPINKLFQAIQHFRNAEVQTIISSNEFDVKKQYDNGYSAIHVAARYNNTFALDLIMQHGALVDSLDVHGNTPLHYAAKSGHLDMCKLLIDRGCSPAKKNNQNQSPYDISENHLVRQYLLPLIFKYENNDVSRGFSDNTYNQQQYSSVGVEAPGMLFDYQHGAVPSTMPTSEIKPTYSNQCIPPATSSNGAFLNPPMVQLQSSLPPQVQVQTPVGPPSAVSNFSQAPIFPSNIVTENLNINNAAYPSSYTPPSQAVNSNVRKIKADGFHSSASDPVLQEKYGHIKPVINIAPPPIASTNTTTNSSFNVYSNATNAYQNTSVYSRYPVYDAVTNTATTIAPPQISQSQPLYQVPSTTPPSPSIQNFNPSIPVYHNIPVQVTQPMPMPMSMSMNIETPINSFIPPPPPLPPQTNNTSSAFLHSPPPYQGSTHSSALHHFSSPLVATSEDEVVSMDATSNSIM